jgi:acyl-CoA synthetase (AMP-forming)/AMP-acid ligase II
LCQVSRLSSIDVTTEAALWTDMLLERWLGSSSPAIVDDDGQLSGDEFLSIAAGASAWFDELGFVAGDAVPALMDESRTSIAMVVGGALSRRPVAPLGTKLSIDDLVVAVKGLEARHLFVDPDRIELAQEVAAHSGVNVVVVDHPLPSATPPDPITRPDDAVTIVHTSGTTGHPKPIRLTQRPLAARVAVYQQVMGIGPGDRFCSASPFYHTAGVAMDVTVLPMGVAIIPQDWFSIDNWRRAGRLGATLVLLVPTMIEMLLAAGALADAHPRVLQYGAMPIHPETLKATLATLDGTRLLQIYGQTEASPISFLSHEDHVLANADRPDLLLSVGRAISGCELRVEGGDVDGIGEIALRAPHVFQRDDDGWRRTGDLGSIDEQGYLFLNGRLNDRIIRGGENIYPTEIETALVHHPAVREAAVIGVPDRKWGEIVKAVVVPADRDAPPTEDELRAHLSDRLAHFKLPSLYEFVSELPRNPSGKILRRALR